MSVRSSLKLLQYLHRVSKEPIIVDGASPSIPVPRAVTLDESFFWSDSCVQCGRCCMNETVVWTQEGLNRILDYIERDEQGENNAGVGIVRVAPEDIEELSEKLVEKTININGVDRIFYEFPRDSAYAGQWQYFEGRGDRQRCHWLRKLGDKFCCGLYPIRSVTCALPHLRFMHIAKTNRTVIRTMQYGRNHRLGCPAEFKPVEEANIAAKLESLKMLKACADDLEIDTWLPEIIEYLEEGGRQSVTFGEDLFTRGGKHRGVAVKSEVREAGNNVGAVSASAKLRFSALLRRKSE